MPEWPHQGLNLARWPRVASGCAVAGVLAAVVPNLAVPDRLKALILGPPMLFACGWFGASLMLRLSVPTRGVGRFLGVFLYYLALVAIPVTIIDLALGLAAGTFRDPRTAAYGFISIAFLIGCFVACEQHLRQRHVS